MRKGIFVTGLLAAFVVPAQAQDKQVVDSIASALETRGLLTPKGSFVLEPSITYSQNSSNRISILGSTFPGGLIGIVEAEDADQATFTASLSGRYGLTDRIEVELRVPWVYRYDNISTRFQGEGVTASPEEVTSSGGGLGDIEAAIRYQFNLETAPYWIGNLRVKSDTGDSPFDNEFDNITGVYIDPPTGSGSWSVEPGVTVIYPTDPAVLFGTAGYTFNLSGTAGRDLNEDGAANDKFQLGDSFFLGMGMGFAVNNRLSFSLGVNHRTVFKPTINGEKVGEMLQIDSLSTGFSLVLTEKTSLNMNLQAGLTEDAPDVEIGFSLPISF